MLSRRKRSFDADPFTDLLFNVLLGFVFMFIMALLLLNPPAKTGIINPKAEYIISVTWEDLRPDDVDTWVQSPTGELVWFRNPEAGLMHLDRDDRGIQDDTLFVDGREIINPLNQEVITLRGTVPGEYTVNIHYYQSKSRKPLDVEVRVDRVNPVLKVVYYNTHRLKNIGDEETAVRFTISADGSVSNVNSRQQDLVRHDLLH